MAEIEVELGVAPLLVFYHRRNNGVKLWTPSGVGVDDMVLLVLPDVQRSGRGIRGSRFEESVDFGLHLRFNNECFFLPQRCYGCKFSFPSKTSFKLM